jgi:hypothetical protein
MTIKMLVNVWFISKRSEKLKWKVNVPVINHNRSKKNEKCMKVQKELERRDHIPVSMKQKRMKYKVGRIVLKLHPQAQNLQTQIYSYKRQYSIFNPYNVTKLFFGVCHGKHNMITY